MCTREKWCTINGKEGDMMHVKLIKKFTFKETSTYVQLMALYMLGGKAIMGQDNENEQSVKAIMGLGYEHNAIFVTIDCPRKTLELPWTNIAPIEPGSIWSEVAKQLC